MSKLLLHAITICAAALSVAAATASAATTKLTVDASAGRHAISPLIYGINFADQPFAKQIGLPVDRFGGDLQDDYDWQQGLTGNSDYFFENMPDCFYFYSGDECSKQSNPFWPTFVRRDLAHGTQPLIGLPMVGSVARDSTSCSFPLAVYATQPHNDGRCGDGIDPAGKPIVDAQTATRAGLPVNEPTFDAAWVKQLVARFHSAARGGVKQYELGNEPMLWNQTHHDIHPAPTTYDELVSKSVALAKAVKAADPGAQTLGFSADGWVDYFCAADDDTNSDGCPASPQKTTTAAAAGLGDRNAHGGQSLVDYFLQRMRAAAAAAKRRLLDYLDIHYYAQCSPSTDPCSYAPATDVTRTLWDPSYVDPSYIGRLSGQAIDLLPRMHDWVTRDYPGTKLSLSEYDLTVGGPQSATVDPIIQADTLGILARSGIDEAAFYPQPWTQAATDPSDSPGSLRLKPGIEDAFRIFRDYDGHGSRFGQTYVSSKSSAQSALAVYGALRASDRALTVLVLNKRASAAHAALTVLRAGARRAASTFTWTAAHEIRRGTATRINGSAHTYPPYSMTLYIIPRAA